MRIVPAPEVTLVNVTLLHTGWKVGKMKKRAKIFKAHYIKYLMVLFYMKKDTHVMYLFYGLLLLLKPITVIAASHLTQSIPSIT